MPRFDSDDMHQGQTGGRFGFSGVRTDKLGASNYTLADIVVDETGSTSTFADELKKMVKASVESLKKNSRSDNILVRVSTFSTRHPNGVREIHGYLPLADIDVTMYDDIDPAGMTPLFDAAFSAVAASNAYGKMLKDDGYDVNSIIIVITDGDDTSSSFGPSRVAAEVDQAISGEVLESCITILIGVNAARFRAKLETFRVEAKFDHYKDVADATPESLAKIGGFISQSVSSQSQSVGSGGPSQNIAATI